MKKIMQDIKTGSFAHIYLLYGQEAYLKKQYRDNLKNALVAEDDSMNYTVFSGKDINQNEMIDLIGTMPFFAERRVILVENSNWFKTSNDRLVEALSAIPDTTYLIFVEDEVDKRNKVFKTVSSVGYAASFDEQKEDTLKTWIVGLLKKENKKITQEALELFLERTGTDMENIKKELEKLICYKLDEDAIELADVEKLCTVRVQNKIFELVDAVADKKQDLALSYYYDLLALKEPSLRILALIVRQFRSLLQVKEMKQLRYDDNEIAARTGLNAYYLKKKYIPQAQRFQMEQLKEAIQTCAQADEDIKSGKLSDQLSVELIIISLSQQKG